MNHSHARHTPRVALDQLTMTPIERPEDDAENDRSCTRHVLDQRTRTIGLQAIREARRLLDEAEERSTQRTSPLRVTRFQPRRAAIRTVNPLTKADSGDPREDK